MTISNSNDSQRLSQEFDITFIDACWSAEIEPVKFPQKSYTYRLYEDDISVLFTPMQVDSECGGKSYELQYVSGPNSGLAREITVTSDRFFASLNSRQWAGTHTFRVNALNGVYDPNSTLGNKGIYGSKTSGPVTITVLDPCNASLISDQAGFIEELEIPFGQTETSYIQKAPKNSASAQYGNGYDLCGPYQYKILNLNKERVESEHFAISAKTDLVNGDDIKLVVSSKYSDGPLIKKDFYVEISYRDYPRQKSLVWPITIQYRECKVESFTASKIFDQTVSYQMVNPVKVFYDFDQGECNFAQSTTAVLVTNSQE